MISPSPLERHVEIARAFGSQTAPLDAAIHLRRRRRMRRRPAIAFDGIESAITIRPAADQDAAAIARLAVLDGHSLPAGPQLVAEAGGKILAAAEVTSGTTIADPFQQSAGVARLVAMRADQMRPRAA